MLIHLNNDNGRNFLLGLKVQTILQAPINFEKNLDLDENIWTKLLIWAKNKRLCTKVKTKLYSIHRNASLLS